MCNGSAPGSAIKEAPQDVCVCLYARKIKGRQGCVYVCVCVCVGVWDWNANDVGWGVCGLQ